MGLEEITKPELYLAAEVAREMDISKHTLYRLVNAGKIKAINVGTGSKRPIWAFRVEDIQAYYDSLQSSIERNQNLNQ